MKRTTIPELDKEREHICDLNITRLYQTDLRQAESSWHKRAYFVSLMLLCLFVGWGASITYTMLTNLPRLALSIGFVLSGITALFIREAYEYEKEHPIR